jgi:L-lactate dehydrogenase complex protein LldF
VCPVKIDIHDQLYKWRQEIVQSGNVAASKKAGIKIMSFVLSIPWLYKFSGWAGRKLMRYFPFFVSNRFNPWYKQREMPAPPPSSFTEWYKKRDKHG